VKDHPIFQVVHNYSLSWNNRMAIKDTMPSSSKGGVVRPSDVGQSEQSQEAGEKGEFHAAMRAELEAKSKLQRPIETDRILFLSDPLPDSLGSPGSCALLRVRIPNA
jgi:hypothetical protein